jgi:hypothetical protein
MFTEIILKTKEIDIFAIHCCPVKKIKEENLDLSLRSRGQSVSYIFGRRQIGGFAANLPPPNKIQPKILSFRAKRRIQIFYRSTIICNSFYNP